jgi:protoheme IX farnesyltransferase
VSQTRKNSIFAAYVALMKLRVVELLLVTTLPALFMAAHKVPSLRVTLATLIGGTLAAGAANAFNMIIEVDSDRLMKRTEKRPLTTGAISLRAANVFATLIAILALAIFWVWTTPLATYLTLGAILFYVLIYTVALKRRTSQNIVWGGIAGCMPVLIGWAAVTNSLSAPAWYFFLVIFFWTPPHFWALAIKYRDDYEAAGIPMLPVIAPIKNVQSQMWFHTIGMILASLAVVWSAHFSVWISAATLIFGLVFAAQLRQLNSGDSTKAAAKLFQGSITYLSIYSLLLVVGVFI